MTAVETLESNRTVDHNIIRINQAFTITLLALAFVLSLPILAGINAVIILLTALMPPLGLYARFYRHALVPAGVVKPDIHVDNPEPHRFASLVGGTCTLLGVVLVLAGVEIVGWGLVGMVIVLASLNLFAGWCAGCLMYYWLNKLGVPGFDRAPIEAAQESM
jgi:hypothetical protein